MLIRWTLWWCILTLAAQATYGALSQVLYQYYKKSFVGVIVWKREVAKEQRCVFDTWDLSREQSYGTGAKHPVCKKMYCFSQTLKNVAW